MNFSFNETFQRFEINEYCHVCREKNGTEIKNVEMLKGRAKVTDRGSNLIISDTQPEDAGKYTCRLPGSSSADFDVIG